MNNEPRRHDCFGANYHRLLGFILRRVGDRATAEDLVQSTYEAALRHPEFDPNRPDAAGFLKQKACWLVQDHRRRSRRNPVPLPARLPDHRTDRPDQLLESEEIRAQVWRGVTRLSKPHQAVMGRRLSGMDHEQIAADLNLPISLVYSRFHHAKAALRRILEEGTAAW